MCGTYSRFHLCGTHSWSTACAKDTLSVSQLCVGHILVFSSLCEELSFTPVYGTYSQLFSVFEHFHFTPVYGIHSQFSESLFFFLLVCGLHSLLYACEWDKLSGLILCVGHTLHFTLVCGTHTHFSVLCWTHSVLFLWGGILSVLRLCVRYALLFTLLYGTHFSFAAVVWDPVSVYRLYIWTHPPFYVCV